MLQHLSEAEYQFQRQIILNSGELAYDSHEEPLPLVLPTAQLPLLKRSIPLYQALLGAACLLLLFFTLLLRKTEENPLAPIPIAQGDRTNPVVHYVYDTVVKEVLVEKIIYQTLKDTIHVSTSIPTPINSNLVLLNPSDQVPLPVLNEQLFQNNSVSALYDESTRLLQNITVMNQPIGW